MQEIITINSFQSINQRIKILRKSNNLTQEEFGVSIGSSRGVIAQVELEKQSPTLEMVKQIVSLYNITYEELIEGKKSEKYSNNAHEPESEYKISVTKMQTEIKTLKEQKMDVYEKCLTLHEEKNLLKDKIHSLEVELAIQKSKK